METYFKPSHDIRFKDLELLIELVKTKSVRELARKVGQTPGQISKLVKNIELRLGVQLLDRSIYGVEATPQAKDILPYLEGIRDLHLKLSGELSKDVRGDFLSFGSASFISTHLLPKTLSQIEADIPGTRFRLIDLPPSQFIPVGLRNGFQLCVHLDDLDSPKTWTSIEVGLIEWDLCCRHDHPLSRRATLHQILKFPFVYPVYWSDEGIRFGNDGCPLSIQKRLRGHETATATSAVELVRHSDQLGFLPHLVTRPLIEGKLLRKLKVTGWKPVTQTLYLSVKSDFVKQSTFLRLKDLLQKNLNS